MKLITGLLGVVLIGPGAVAVAVPAVATSSLTSILGGAVGPGPAGGHGSGPAAIPPAVLADDRAAAAACPGLSWSVLAAIGTVESANGTADLPGVHSGANPAGAEGPMQFEPATFAAYARPVPAGGADPPNPYDPLDAAFAAARMLCADGAATPAGLPGAVYDYNHSAAYVADVLSIARGYADAGSAPGTGSGPAEPDGPGLVAVAYAEAELGVPYRWGAEDPGVAFDCSGLAQAAWAAAGVSLPRVAQDQFDAGPPVAPGAPLAPGDLVFFGSSPADVAHVGIVVQPGGEMIDAPHTGAVIRLEPFTPVVGAAWGGDVLIGATRPG
jgi:cell wall-associated NlpC family hydrolase